MIDQKYKRVKITVIKCTYNEDVALQYANLENKNLKQCPRHKEGDVYYTDFKKPPELCDEAWKSIQHYVFALAHGGHGFFQGNFCRYDNMAVITCPDAFKTITMKIETVDEDE